jgi:hypothetical protein
MMEKRMVVVLLQYAAVNDVVVEVGEHEGAGA